MIRQWLLSSGGNSGLSAPGKIPNKLNGPVGPQMKGKKRKKHTTGEKKTARQIIGRKKGKKEIDMTGSNRNLSIWRRLGIAITGPQSRENESKALESTDPENLPVGSKLIDSDPSSTASGPPYTISSSPSEDVSHADDKENDLEAVNQKIQKLDSMKSKATRRSGRCTQQTMQRKVKRHWEQIKKAHAQQKGRSRQGKMQQRQRRQRRQRGDGKQEQNAHSSERNKLTEITVVDSKREEKLEKENEKIPRESTRDKAEVEEQGVGGETEEGGNLASQEISDGDSSEQREELSESELVKGEESSECEGEKGEACGILPMQENLNSRGSGGGMSEYEKQRLENIRKNMEFLASLGIQKTHFGSKKSSKSALKKKSKSSKAPTPKLPLRRSSRRRGLPPERAQSMSRQPEPEIEPESEEELVFDDSSVVKYTCAAASQGSKLFDTERKAARITGVRRITHEPYEDPNLKKMYAIDFASFSHQIYVAAAGHQGRVAVFGVSDRKSTEEEELSEPLLSFRAHKSWIGGLKFISKKNSCPLLLTAANDSGLRVWDITKVANSKSKGVTARMVTEDYDIHRQGVYSLDAVGSSIAMASKDSTVSYSVIAESSIKNQCFLEDHSGVVKSVRMRSESILASAGNDRRICIWDVRQPSDTSNVIKSAADSPINAVRWDPINDHILACASMDPYLRVFDIRKPSEPVHVFSGHNSQSMRCYCHVSKLGMQSMRCYFLVGLLGMLIRADFCVRLCFGGSVVGSQL
ncbi:hypothetical protein AAMO2058_001017500 [Amorphochlora amoebiformis]